MRFSTLLALMLISIVGSNVTFAKPIETDSTDMEMISNDSSIEIPISEAETATTAKDIGNTTATVVESIHISPQSSFSEKALEAGFPLFFRGRTGLSLIALGIVMSTAVGLGAAATAIAIRIEVDANDIYNDLIRDAAGMGASAAALDFVLQWGASMLLAVFCALAYNASGVENDTAAVRGGVLGSYLGTFAGPLISTSAIAQVSGADRETVATAAIAGLAIGAMSLVSRCLANFFLVSTMKPNNNRNNSGLFAFGFFMRYIIQGFSGMTGAAILDSNLETGLVLSLFSMTVPLVGLLPAINSKIQQ